VAELERAALTRLDTEAALSEKALANGGDRSKEQLILKTWADWYQRAIQTMSEIEVGGSSPETERAIKAADTAVQRAGVDRVARLR
jgi:hypothetical protein